MISMIENNRARPSIATLFKLASALGMRPQDLLPTEGTFDVTVVAAGGGVPVRISEASVADDGRVLVSGPDRLLEVTEYELHPGVLPVFQHGGEEFIRVLRRRSRGARRRCSPRGALCW